MVPAAFVVLEALPLTPNGKVDRGSLPVPSQDRPDLGTTFVAPQTRVEILLAEIWQEVLGIGQVGVYDNFFDLGGHSLLSLQVTARVEKAVGLRLNPGELMIQSLGQLAASCDERMKGCQASNHLGFTKKVLTRMKAVMFRMVSR